MQNFQHKALCYNKCNLQPGKFLPLFSSFFLIAKQPKKFINEKIQKKKFSHPFRQNISILVVLLYSWQINVNTKKFQILGDVYYGVQISYYAIISSHLSIIILSIVLFIGINTVSNSISFLIKKLAKLFLYSANESESSNM